MHRAKLGGRSVAAATCHARDATAPERELCASVLETATRVIK